MSDKKKKENKETKSSGDYDGDDGDAGNNSPLDGRLSPYSAFLARQDAADDAEDAENDDYRLDQVTIDYILNAAQAAGIPVTIGARRQADKPTTTITTTTSATVNESNQEEAEKEKDEPETDCHVSTNNNSTNSSSSPLLILFDESTTTTAQSPAVPSPPPPPIQPTETREPLDTSTVEFFSWRHPEAADEQYRKLLDSYVTSLALLEAELVPNWRDPLLVQPPPPPPPPPPPTTTTTTTSGDHDGNIHKSDSLDECAELNSLPLWLESMAVQQPLASRPPPAAAAKRVRIDSSPAVIDTRVLKRPAEQRQQQQQQQQPAHQEQEQQVAPHTAALTVLDEECSVARRSWNVSSSSGEPSVLTLAYSSARIKAHATIECRTPLVPPLSLHFRQQVSDFLVPFLDAWPASLARRSTSPPQSATSRRGGKKEDERPPLEERQIEIAIELEPAPSLSLSETSTARADAEVASILGHLVDANNTDASTYVRYCTFTPETAYYPPPSSREDQDDDDDDDEDDEDDEEDAGVRFRHNGTPFPNAGRRTPDEQQDASALLDETTEMRTTTRCVRFNDDDDDDERALPTGRPWRMSAAVAGAANSEGDSDSDDKPKRRVGFKLRSPPVRQTRSSSNSNDDKPDEEDDASSPRYFRFPAIAHARRERLPTLPVLSLPTIERADTTDDDSVFLNDTTDHLFAAQPPPAATATATNNASPRTPTPLTPSPTSRFQFGEAARQRSSVAFDISPPARRSRSRRAPPLAAALALAQAARTCRPSVAFSISPPPRHPSSSNNYSKRTSEPQLHQSRRPLNHQPRRTTSITFNISPPPPLSSRRLPTITSNLQEEEEGEEAATSAKTPPPPPLRFSQFTPSATATNTAGSVSRSSSSLSSTERRQQRRQEQQQQQHARTPRAPRLPSSLHRFAALNAHSLRRQQRMARVTFARRPSLLKTTPLVAASADRYTLRFKTDANKTYIELVRPLCAPANRPQPQQQQQRQRHQQVQAGNAQAATAPPPPPQQLQPQQVVPVDDSSPSRALNTTSEQSVPTTACANARNDAAPVAAAVAQPPRRRDILTEENDQYEMVHLFGLDDDDDDDNEDRDNDGDDDDEEAARIADAYSKWLQSRGRNGDQP